MKLKDIIEFLDEKIPPSLALDHDEVGFKGNYDLTEEINSIKIYMDLLPEDDLNYENTLISTNKIENNENKNLSNRIIKIISSFCKSIETGSFRLF